MKNLFDRISQFFNFILKNETIDYVLLGAMDVWIALLLSIKKMKLARLVQNSKSVFISH